MLITDNKLEVLEGWQRGNQIMFHGPHPIPNIWNFARSLGRKQILQRGNVPKFKQNDIPQQGKQNTVGTYSTILVLNCKYSLVVRIVQYLSLRASAREFSLGGQSAISLMLSVLHRFHVLQWLHMYNVRCGPLGGQLPNQLKGVCHLPTNNHYIFPRRGSHCFHL